MPFHKVNGKWLMVNRNRAKKSIHYSLFTIHRNGFTLVEVLIFLILVLAMVTVLLISSGSLRQSRNTNLQTIAAGIATCEIERLRDLAYDSLPADGTVAIGSPCASDLAKLPTPSSANLTLANYQSDVNIKQITIVVSWTESGVADNIQMDTLKAKYGT